MRPTVSSLVAVIDAFLTADGEVRETTLSYRVFGDSKKIAAMRAGAEITLGRYNDAMHWLNDNWPEGAAVPPALGPYATREAAE